MIDVAFAGLETAAGVLADAAVAFPETAEREAEAAAGHSGEACENEDGGCAHGTADGADREVVIADWEGEPFGPFDWAHAIVGDVEGAGGTSGQHAESIGGRFDVDGLPVPVEHQHSGTAENIAHGCSGVLDDAAGAGVLKGTSGAGRTGPLMRALDLNAQLFSRQPRDESECFSGIAELVDGAVEDAFGVLAIGTAETAGDGDAHGGAECGHGERQ